MSAKETGSDENLHMGDPFIGKRRRSSSILKPPKSPGRLPLKEVTSAACQSEEDGRRKSPARRVSFADTHQIKEYVISDSSGQSSEHSTNGTRGNYNSTNCFYHGQVNPPEQMLTLPNYVLNKTIRDGCSMDFTQPVEEIPPDDALTEDATTHFDGQSMFLEETKIVGGRWSNTSDRMDSPEEQPDNSDFKPPLPKGVFHPSLIERDIASKTSCGSQAGRLPELPTSVPYCNPSTKCENEKSRYLNEEMDLTCQVSLLNREQQVDANSLLREVRVPSTSPYISEKGITTKAEIAAYDGHTSTVNIPLANMSSSLNDFDMKPTSFNSSESSIPYRNNSLEPRNVSTESVYQNALIEKADDSLKDFGNMELAKDVTDVLDLNVTVMNENQTEGFESAGLGSGYEGNLHLNVELKSISNNNISEVPKTELTDDISDLHEHSSVINEKNFTNDATAEETETSIHDNCSDDSKFENDVGDFGYMKIRDEAFVSSFNVPVSENVEPNNGWLKLDSFTSKEGSSRFNLRVDSGDELSPTEKSHLFEMKKPHNIPKNVEIRDHLLAVPSVESNLSLSAMDTDINDEVFHPNSPRRELVFNKPENVEQNMEKLVIGDFQSNSHAVELSHALASTSEAKHQSNVPTGAVPKQLVVPRLRYRAQAASKCSTPGKKKTNEIQRRFLFLNNVQRNLVQPGKMKPAKQLSEIPLLKDDAPVPCPPMSLEVPMQVHVQQNHVEVDANENVSVPLLCVNKNSRKTHSARPFSLMTKLRVQNIISKLNQPEEDPKQREPKLVSEDSSSTSLGLVSIPMTRARKRDIERNSQKALEGTKAAMESKSNVPHHSDCNSSVFPQETCNSSVFPQETCTGTLSPGKPNFNQDSEFVAIQECKLISSQINQVTNVPSMSIKTPDHSTDHCLNPDPNASPFFTSPCTSTLLEKQRELNTATLHQESSALFVLPNKLPVQMESKRNSLDLFQQECDLQKTTANHLQVQNEDISLSLRFPMETDILEQIFKNKEAEHEITNSCLVDFVPAPEAAPLNDVPEHFGCSTPAEMPQRREHPVETLPVHSMQTDLAGCRPSGSLGLKDGHLNISGCASAIAVVQDSSYQVDGVNKNLDYKYSHQVMEIDDSLNSESDILPKYKQTPENKSASNGNKFRAEDLIFNAPNDNFGGNEKPIVEHRHDVGTTVPKVVWELVDDSFRLQEDLAQPSTSTLEDPSIELVRAPDASCSFLNMANISSNIQLNAESCEQSLQSPVKEESALSQFSDDDIYLTDLYRHLFPEEEAQDYWKILVMEKTQVAFLFLKCIYLVVALSDQPAVKETHMRRSKGPSVWKIIRDIGIGIAKRDQILMFHDEDSDVREVAFKLVKLNLELEKIKSCYTTTKKLPHILHSVSDVAYRAHTFIKDMDKLYTFFAPSVIHTDENTEITLKFSSIILGVIFKLSFRINLKTYPFGAIKPKYHHMQRGEWNVEACVIDAAMNERTGVHYLYRMVKAVNKRLYLEAGKRRKPTDPYAEWIF